MAVTVNNNYEVEVTLEKWLKELHDALPEDLKKELYRGFDKNGMPSSYSFVNLSTWPSYNKKLEEYYQTGEGDIDEIIDDYVWNASKRLYNIYKEAKNPYIFEGNYTKPYSDRANTLDIPFVTPMLFGITNPRKLIAELSHPILSKYGKNKFYTWKNIKNLILRAFDKDLDSRLYDDPSLVEYETHTDFEPLLYNYIYRGETPEWLLKRYNGGKLIPKKRFIK